MPIDPMFDPYLIFEVKHKHCAIIHIRVIRGRRITKGWAADLLDTPDPYLILKLANSPQSWRKTSVKDNDVNPEWDETFSFWLDPDEEHVLEMSLMDANYTVDEHLDSEKLPLTPLPIGKRFKTTVGFNETSEIDFEIWGEILDKTDLRYSLTLCNEEKKFIETRKRKVLKYLKEHYGFAAPRNYKEVPVIGVIGSGGGFRAMTGYSGAISALAQLGILNMVTYVGGLSGSAWYLSQLYSHPKWPNISPGDQREELKQNVDHSFLWLFRSHGIKFAKEVWTKRSRGEPVSFTDLFGHLVGNTLISDRLDTRLSDQRQKINEGQCPMPLYTCLHVKKAVSAMIFHEWMEFSPYEIGLPKYGTYLKPEQFSCKFFMGAIIKHYPEPPLHFLQGIWGSAFCIQFKRLLQDDKKLAIDKVASMDERDSFEEELKKDLSVYDQEDSESDEDEDPGEKGTHGNQTTGGLQRRRSKSTKMKTMTFWESMVSRVLDSKMFQTIELRAAQVFNFMRGLSLNNVLPFSPFTQSQEEEDENNKPTFSRIHDLHPTSVKKLYVVDSGLTFNSPYPVMLRPPREVDLIISFDFSARATDDTEPFKELLLAAKWAELNKVPFPPIDPDIVKKEGFKECYVFRHPWDPNCPIVVHFVLVNINFRQEIIPGVPRTTNEEMEFGNFNIFDDPKKPYSTFKFTYTHQEFDRLSKLMEYNTLLHRDTIFDNISRCIKRKRKYSIRRPCSQKDISRLSLNSRVQVEKLREYIAMAEKMAAEAEQDEKNTRKRRPLVKQQEIDRPRPISSPIQIGKDELSGQEVCKLTRSTVSLRPNNRRTHNQNETELSLVTEKSEENEDEQSPSETPSPTGDHKRDKKVTLSRSKPVTSSLRPMRDPKEMLNGAMNNCSIIQEEDENSGYNSAGRRRSRDDTDIGLYRQRLKKLEKENSEKSLSSLDSVDGRLSGRSSPNPRGVGTGNGVAKQNGSSSGRRTASESGVSGSAALSDQSALDKFLGSADRVTDL